MGMQTMATVTKARVPVVVFAPSPVVTVTLEADPQGRTELHFHAGGQGVWTARMIQSLGGDATVCAALGGESGTVLRALIGAEHFELCEVWVEHPSGAYVHDRREGTRAVVGEGFPLPLNRHELDALYGATFAAAVAAGTCVLTGTVPSVVPVDTFRRLTADLCRNGVDVIVDTSRECLAAALAGGPGLVKLSHEELLSGGYAEGDAEDQLLDGIARLQAAGARDVVVSRAGEPVLASLGGRRVAVECPPVEVVDPTGGGDTMTAAFAVARARGLSDDDALRLAVAAATLNVTRHGLATGRREDIERLAEVVVLRELEPRVDRERVVGES
jgi:1-phosphofructokinase